MSSSAGEKARSTPSELPRLHRVARHGADRAVWRIADSMLTVTAGPSRAGWLLVPSTHGVSPDDERHRQAHDWLTRHGLRGAKFATRTDAVRTATAFLAIDPLPDLRPAQLRRTGPSSWQTPDGQIAVRRLPNTMLIAQRRGQHAVLVTAPTLGEMRRRLLTHIAAPAAGR